MATGDESPSVTGYSIESHDATARKRAEEEVRLLLSITQAIDAADNFESTLKAVLREVCEATGWSYGEAWLSHPNGTVLESSPAWHSSTDALTTFRRVSEQITFPPGDGLPGRVWLSRQPEWIEDLWTRPDTVFFRADAAQEAGLKAGLGIPITANGEVLAVLVFFVSEPREEDRRLVELISAVAQQLGGLFQRKRAEAALRESEERYRLIVENTNEVIYKVSLEDDPLRGSVEFVSGQVKSILGYAPDEFLQNPELWLQIVHPDEVPALGEITRKTFADREPGTRQYRLRHKETGEYRWMEDKTVPLTDGDGNVVAYQGVARDISERKQAEEALRDSKLLLEKTFASLDEAVFLVEPNTRTIIACNSAAERIFGYSEKEMVGRNTEFLHVDRAMYEIFGRKLFPALDADGILHTGHQMRRKDGSVLFTEHTVTEIVDDSGQRTGVVSVLRDITEHKRAEDALRESEERYHTLYEDNPSMYFTVDTAGTVLSVNRFGAEELGYTADELVGRSVLEVFYEPDREAVQKQLSLCVKNPDQVTDWEFRKVRKDGSILWVKEAMRAVRGPRGDTTVLVVCEDISERKQVEEALRESDERYRALVESAFEGIVISRAGKILEANESFARMFGYELPEVIGLSPVEMTTPESAELILNNVQSGFEKPYEITGIKKDGATISIEVIGKKCVYQGREARITAFRDITEIKRAEEARQQARDELEGRVEHQILRRNPYGLTFRELTVLHLVAAGKSDKEIGIDLGISVLTARKHLSNILAKMDAASRTEAVARGLREGLLD